MQIPKGSAVGLLGESGSGKSTLMDLAMGLLIPSSGFIRVDNEPLTPTNITAWQQRFANVPQVFCIGC